MAHNEPPHQDLCCLQIQLLLSLVVKELRCNNMDQFWVLSTLKVNKSLSMAIKCIPLDHQSCNDENFWGDNFMLFLLLRKIVVN